MKNSQTCTVASLIAEPGKLVSVADLIEANIVTSDQAARRWADRGWLPPPIRLPNNQLRWLAGSVVKTAGLEQATT